MRTGRLAPSWLLDGALRHAALLLNASALATGTLASAALGFVYWWWAASQFPAAAVGYAAAAISLMNLLAHVGEIGLGPFLTGELGRHTARGTLLSASLLACAVASATLAVGYLVAADVLDIEMGVIAASVRGDTIFVLGCVLTGITIVLDQAFVGLLRGGLQMMRNTIFATAKLALLVALPFFAPSNELGIFLTWVGGQALSLVLIGSILAARGSRIVYRPDLSHLRPVLRQMAGHHVLNITIQAPGLILPFLLTVVLSAELNAAFYAAWTLVNVALLVPASLAAVLFSVARHEPEEFASRLRLSLGLSCLCAAGAAGLFLIFSPEILALFSKDYPGLAGEAIRFLGFAVAGIALKYHYLAVQRIRSRLGPAAFLLAAGAAIEIGAAAFGGAAWGLKGFINAWVAAVLVQGLLMAPLLVLEMRRPRSGRETPLRLAVSGLTHTTERSV